MAETTSGTQLFNLPIDDIIQDAYNMLGGEHTTGYDAVQARRALNLLFIELQNRKIPLGNIKEHTLNLTEGTSSYELPDYVIDVLDAYIVRDSLDYEIERISLFEYNEITDKAQKGRPTQFAIHRERDNCKLFLYQSPENSTDIFTYWSFDKNEDVTKSYQLLDISTRFLPAIIYGLAHKLSIIRPGITLERSMKLEQEFEKALMFAFEEDRERTDFYVSPCIPSVLSRV